MLVRWLFTTFQKVFSFRKIQFPLFTLGSFTFFTLEYCQTLETSVTPQNCKQGSWVFLLAFIKSNFRDSLFLGALMGCFKNFLTPENKIKTPKSYYYKSAYYNQENLARSWRPFLLLLLRKWKPKKNLNTNNDIIVWGTKWSFPFLFSFEEIISNKKVSKPVLGPPYQTNAKVF